MFQSHVYLEVRILISTEKKVFTDKKTPSIYSPVAEKVCMLARSLGCNLLGNSNFELLTTTLNLPENCDFSGLSLKAAENGCVQIEFHRRKKNIKIQELRIEEDAGRLTHSNGTTRMDYTWAGSASVRIKTAADFELGEEAELFLDEIRRRIQYLKIVDNIPVDFLIRCNAHVALSRYPEMPSYYVKLRNLNSFNFVRKAINAELSRQEEILSSGGVVESESRLWNERQNRTESYKNRIADGRHFENLEPLVSFDFVQVAEKFFADEAQNLAELPEERRKRLCSMYNLSRTRAEFICDDKFRADFLEEAISYGADAMMAAHWLSSELMKLLRWHGKKIQEIPLTAKRFACIMQLLQNGEIHSSIAKQLMQKVIEEDSDPEKIIEKNNWKQIIDEATLLPLVKETIDANPQETEKLRQGDMAPLEFLTGLIMKKTEGMASPVVVKTLLKRELKISVVYILSMGGSICGSSYPDGDVGVTDGKILKNLLSDVDSSVRYQIIQVGKLLSEEIEPADWALLIAEIAKRIEAGTATGIVVAHGTDTLSYTAPLLYWLFSDSGVPIVVTASSTPSDVSNEAKNNLMFAVETACKEKKGVFVTLNGKILSPLNLKFERPTPDGFTNWNIKENLHVCVTGPLSGQFISFQDADPFVMKQILREAANCMLVCRVYPGLRAEKYLHLIDNGIKYIFLELYETGTASMRTGDYSLKSLLVKGRKKGCRFFCTSQQQSRLDFSGYTTSRRVWREGAVPMGSLTTESAIALYFASSLVSDNAEELHSIIESYSELFE